MGSDLKIVFGTDCNKLTNVFQGAPREIDIHSLLLCNWSALSRVDPIVGESVHSLDFFVRPRHLQWTRARCLEDDASAKYIHGEWHSVLPHVKPLPMARRAEN